MGRILFATFVIVPIIEIGLFVALGDIIGFWWTMGAVVFTAVLGSVLLRLQGFAILNRIQTALNAGTFPGREIVDGVMMAVAGVLLLTPGFFTDAIGFSLFVPGVRQAIFRFVRSKISVVGNGPGPQKPDQNGPTIDMDSDQWRGNAK
ncbi:MAG: FxsA family protein [Alphaproteobacteria bacterium]|nr:FxsA family protein [Alphaproteobacteria bacterium]